MTPCPHEPAVVLAVMNDRLDNLKVLKQFGADMNMVTYAKKKTLVMLAAQGGYLDILDYLYKQVTNIDARDDAGNTAVVYALYGRRLDSLESLVRHGANAFVTNLAFRTPIKIADQMHFSDGYIFLDQVAHSNGLKPLVISGPPSENH